MSRENPLANERNTLLAWERHRYDDAEEVWRCTIFMDLFRSPSNDSELASLHYSEAKVSETRRQTGRPTKATPLSAGLFANYNRGIGGGVQKVRLSEPGNLPRRSCLAVANNPRFS